MVDDMLQGKVISLYQDRFEWGPARWATAPFWPTAQLEMKRLSMPASNSREPFRPFAPVVLESEAANYWDGIDDAAGTYALRYMFSRLSRQAGDGAEDSSCDA